MPAADGVTLLDSDGKVKLFTDGTVRLSDGADDTCCCGCCTVDCAECDGGKTSISYSVEFFDVTNPGNCVTCGGVSMKYTGGTLVGTSYCLANDDLDTGNECAYSTQFDELDGPALGLTADRYLAADCSGTPFGSTRLTTLFVEISGGDITVTVRSVVGEFGGCVYWFKGTATSVNCCGIITVNNDYATEQCVVDVSGTCPNGSWAVLGVGGYAVLTPCCEGGI